MPLSIENTTVTTDWVEFGGGSNYGSGWILVFNGFVEVQLAHGRLHGQTTWSPAYTLPAGITPIGAGGRPDVIVGFRIRALNGVLSATPQQFMAALFEPGLAGLTPSTPFPASINSSGGVNPCPCGGGGGGGALDVTDGVTDVNPTTELFIGSGIILDNPAPNVARIKSGGPVVLNYTQITTTVAVTSRSVAAPNNIVTASAAVTLDGSTRIRVSFFSMGVTVGAGASSTELNLWEGANELGAIAFFASPSASIPATVSRIFTPSAGSYTYSIKAWSTINDGSVQAGTGGVGGVPMPAYILVEQLP